MITLQQFVDFIEEHEDELKPAELQDYDVKTIIAHKVNRTLHGVTVTPKNYEPFTVSPTLYIEFYYEDLILTGKCKPEEAATKIMQDLCMALENVPESANDYRNVLSDDAPITFRIINYERNAEMLKDRPHRQFLDLAVVYYVPLEVSEDMTANVVISNATARMMGTTEEMLYKRAKKDSPKNLPVKISTMQEVLTELNPACIEDLLETTSNTHMMYVCSNKHRCNGAATILYDGVLKELADKVGSDLIILPSSIHEVILIPDNEYLEYACLRQMVQEVNATAVAEDEFLSDSVYIYRRNKDAIEILEEEQFTGKRTLH